jgi:type IV pilus assembly protein PilA
VGESGFSLTELLIVVSLLLLLAAVVFPRVTHSRLATDEASAMQGLREVYRAQAQYASRHPDKGFSGDLGELAADLSPTENFDPNLAAGHKSGYLFIYLPGERVNGSIRTYTITAVPEKVGETGQRRFFADESGEVRYNASGPAGATSPVIQ